MKKAIAQHMYGIQLQKVMQTEKDGNLDLKKSKKEKRKRGYSINLIQIFIETPMTQKTWNFYSYASIKVYFYLIQYFHPYRDLCSQKNIRNSKISSVLNLSKLSQCLSVCNYSKIRMMKPGTFLRTPTMLECQMKLH